MTTTVFGHEPDCESGESVEIAGLTPAQGGKPRFSVSQTGHFHFERVANRLKLVPGAIAQPAFTVVSRVFVAPEREA